jgi:hypothetical protein
MVYFIRAKSYYRYALDLFKDLPHLKGNLSELQKKVQDIFKIGLKAIWALSQITTPEKPPSFEEIWKKALESVEPEEAQELKKIKEAIFSEKVEDSETLIKNAEIFLEIIKNTLRPIL